MRSRLRGLLYALAVFSLASCGADSNENENEPLGTAREDSTTLCPPVTVEGLDISAGQGVVDWTKVKASGREFAIIKATQGDYYTSKEWAAQWSGAKAAGLLRSAYHFFDPTVDGVAQAQHFLNVVGPLGPGDLPPMLDIECPTSSDQASTQPNCEYGGQNPDSGWAPAGVLNQRIHDWLDYVQKQTGKTPLIYSYNYWFGDSGADSSTLHKYPLVISWPTATNCFKVGLGNDFTDAAFWQWSVGGTPCPGVSTDVDLDRYNGSLSQLRALAGLGGLSQVSGNDAMTLVNWPSDGHPEIFVHTKSGQMLHTYPDKTTDTWSMMYPLDTGSTCGAAAAFWPVQGYAELFDPAADGSAQHLWLEFGKGWNTWQHDLGSAGSPLSHLSTLAWPDGHLELFGLGADHAIWHSHFDQTADKSWAPWESLGGSFVTGAAAITWNDGHAEIFATGTDGAAWHDWSGAFPGGWHGWDSLGGSLASRPVPVRWADGHLEVFATGQDGQLHHSSYGAAWSPFDGLSPGTAIQGEPSAVMNPEGNGGVAGAEVFARDAGGKVVHLGWDGKAYTAFAPLLDQASASDPFGWIREDGRAEVFAIDPQGVLTRSYHDGDKGWTPWAAIGGMDLDPCLPAAVPPPDGGSGAGVGGGSAGSGGGSAGGGGSGEASAKAGCSCRAGEGDSPGWGMAGILLLAGAMVGRRRRARSFN